MSFFNIIQKRLIAQNLTAQHFSTPSELVNWMGAMQAQDYEMAKWAIGTRLPNTTEKTVEDALNNGVILRTHILRPTWHIVSRENIRWMLALTAPHIERIAAGYYKNLGIDSDLRHKTNNLIEKALHEHKNLTRDEIMQELNKHNIIASDLKAAHIMFHAELTGLVCSGTRKGKAITYALLDDRAPITPPIHRDEALAKLAKLYFQSHSPATMKDFAWWSGLPMGDVRKAIDFVKDQLEIFEIEQTTYYNLPLQNPSIVENDVFLLPAFDEYMVSYTNRSAALPPQYAAQAISNNGIFKPILVHEGKVIGLWKRTLKPKHIEVELLPFEPISPLLEHQIQERFVVFQNYAADNQQVIRFK